MAAGPVLLDNTVLTNFALVARPDLVLDFWGAHCATTLAVMAEYQAGVSTRGLPAGIWDVLDQLSLQPAEQDFADRLPPRLGQGERSCIATAVHRQGLFVCDDAEARREARRLGLKITGSIGILILNVRQSRLALANGNIILADMVAQGYRSPVVTLDDLL